MKRSGPIARKAPIRKKPPRRVAKLTPGDLAYRRWLHLRPCVGLAAFVAHSCGGRTEQSHERNMTGLGLKADERRSVPMCSDLHRAWEQHRGWFRGWSKEMRRDWMDDRITNEHAAFERNEGCPF